MNDTTTDHPHHLQQSASFEVRFICDGDAKGRPVDDQYGSGRTLGRFLDVAGRRVDRSLSKVAERLGCGPRVTAERIRRRLNLIKDLLRRYDLRCRCNFLGPGEERLDFLASIKAEMEKLVKDVRQLVKYVNSNVPSTQKQAIDHILDLSVNNYDIRTLLKQMDVSKCIENLVQVHSDFRHGDGYYDNILLSSSCKALVSLRGAEVNTLLRQWYCLHNVPFQDNYREDIAIPLWRKMTPFLRDRDAAFLVMRTLRGTMYRWCLSDNFAAQIMPEIGSCMANTPEYLEWEECEAISYGIFSRSYVMGTRSSFINYILRFAGNIPRVLDSRPFLLLSTKISEMDRVAFKEAHLLKAALLGLEKGEWRDERTEATKYLHHLQGVFDCPVERAICNVVWELEDEPDIIVTICAEIARYIDSDDPRQREKAWEYANYYLNLDLWSCDLALKALSVTAFATTVDFDVFIRAKRAKHVPNRDDLKTWKTVYRHDGRLCLDEHCSCNGAKREKMQYPIDWISYVHVQHGSPVSTAGHCPIIASYRQDGLCMYLARVQYPRVICVLCDSYVSENYSAVMEGTQPEDLRVEVSCLHMQRLIVPNEINILVLRYRPDEYPEAFYGGGDGLDATGPFSWKPAKKRKERRSPFTIRVMYAEEAEADVKKLDEEANWDGQDVPVHRSILSSHEILANPRDCREIIRIVGSVNAELRRKAWEHINYFLARNINGSDAMLNALRMTSFGASVDFTASAFKGANRTKHVPKQDDIEA